MDDSQSINTKLDENIRKQAISESLVNLSELLLERNRRMVSIVSICRDKHSSNIYQKIPFGIITMKVMTFKIRASELQGKDYAIVAQCFRIIIIVSYILRPEFKNIYWSGRQQG